MNELLVSFRNIKESLERSEDRVLISLQEFLKKSFQLLLALHRKTPDTVKRSRAFRTYDLIWKSCLRTAYYLPKDKRMVKIYLEFLRDEIDRFPKIGD